MDWPGGQIPNSKHENLDHGLQDATPAAMVYQIQSSFGLLARRKLTFPKRQAEDKSGGVWVRKDASG